jgi:hypothetical protein
MPLSDDAFKKYAKWPESNREIYTWVHKHSMGPTRTEHPEDNPRIKGDFIYTPHDCEFPDAWETTLGSIWACHGYRDGRMCYDQWILESASGAKRWVLFKRNMRG